jgi:hypothetical protein
VRLTRTQRDEGKQLRSREKSVSCICFAGRTRGQVYGSIGTTETMGGPPVPEKGRNEIRPSAAIFLLDCTFSSSTARVSRHQRLRYPLRHRLDRYRTRRQPVEHFERFWCAGLEGRKGGIGVEFVQLWFGAPFATRQYSLSEGRQEEKAKSPNAPSSTPSHPLLPLPPFPNPPN